MARNYLNYQRVLALSEFVVKHYVESNMDNVEFAKKAAATLGFPVTGGNVAGSLQALGIELNVHRLARERAEVRARKEAERRARAAADAIANPSRCHAQMDSRVYALEAMISDALTRINALERRQIGQATLDV